MSYLESLELFCQPLAYIGPGAGLSAIGALLAVLAAILAAIVGFVWYPIKRLLRRQGKSN